jgi:predicted nucleic acid-binding protein
LPATVIDCSVTAAWFIPQERTEATQILLDQVIEDGAVVPLHWRLEVGNALLMALRRSRLSAAQRDDALAQLIRLQLTTDTETNDRAWTESLHLAERFRLTLYDACYLELAQRRRLSLASLDAELRAAAQVLHIPVLGL